MNVTAFTQTEPALDLAMESLFRFLSAAFTEPRMKTWRLVLDPTHQTLAKNSAELLRSEAPEGQRLGFGELPPEDLQLAPLLKHLQQGPAAVQDAYTQAFGLVTCRECPPYETEYQPVDDTFFRSQQLADIAGFYRAFGLAPSSATRERPDQLSLELEFMAFLYMKERESIARDGADSANATTCRGARKAFFKDHLGWWGSSFSLALRKKAESGYYYELGRVLSALVTLERWRHQLPAPHIPLEAHTTDDPNNSDGCGLEFVELKT